jgi:hypothetical protein
MRIMKITTIWDEVPGRLLSPYSGYKMEAAASSEMFLNFNQTIWHWNPDHNIHYTYWHKKPNYHILSS